MDIELVVYVSVGVLSAAWVFLAMWTVYIWSENKNLKKQVQQIGSSRIRVQKLKMEADSNHAYQNPTLAPDEELSRRGYSMYSGHDRDLEAAQGQNSNPVFVEDLPRQSNRLPSKAAPPFLLHSIETNKQKSLANPAANGRLARNSSSNPNFMY